MRLLHWICCTVFAGRCGTLLSQENTKAQAPPPTLFVAGDSTASNGLQNGWGSHLYKFFDPDQVGQERVTALYFDGRETTHTNAMGAQQNATCVVSGIQVLEACPLKDYLKAVKPQ